MGGLNRVVTLGYCGHISTVIVWQAWTNHGLWWVTAPLVVWVPSFGRLTRIKGFLGFLSSCPALLWWSVDSFLGDSYLFHPGKSLWARLQLWIWVFHPGKGVFFGLGRVRDFKFSFQRCFPFGFRVLAACFAHQEGKNRSDDSWSGIVTSHRNADAKSEGMVSLCLALAETQLLLFTQALYLNQQLAIRETFHIKLAVPVKFMAALKATAGGDNTHSSWSDSEQLRAGGPLWQEGMAAQLCFYCEPDPPHANDRCLGASPASVLILLQIQQHKCLAEGETEAQGTINNSSQFSLV